MVVDGYLHAPSTTVAEVINGELSLLPRPRPRCANAATRLTGRLRGFSDPEGDDPGGWVILAEPELHPGNLPDIIAPDLAGWHRARFPTNALDDAPAHPEVAPDWCCEVLSPHTTTLDRGDKMRIYRREGVGHYWLLDPLARTLEVLRLDGKTYRVVDVFVGDAVVRAEPIDAIELPLAALWRV